MLITQLKAKEAITSLTAGKKVFIINCHGCKEVRFPEKEAARLQKELADEGYLNLTGGICPITACSKSLVNGQCGGSKNGKCEVDSEMECGWERIYRRLKEIGRLDALKCPTQIHNFATDDEVK